MKIEKLKIQFEKCCNEYIKQFAKKQGLEFDYWIGDEVGGIASFIDQYVFNLDDIRYDLEENIPKGEILEWQNNNIEVATEGKWINYKSYCIGLRINNLK